MIIRLTVITSILLFTTAAFAQEYPLTIEHKFGTTVIDAAPERVGTLSHNGIDNLLALGFQPVFVREWYGDYPGGAWPWAAQSVNELPVVIDGNNINFEQIALTKPDVITALWSGISAETYERLSLIAPVVAVPDGVGDFALPWDELAIQVGRATGREAEARRQVDAIRAQLVEIARAHPEWQGLSVAVADYVDDTPGVNSRFDIRMQLLAEMGFVSNPQIDALTADQNINIDISEEALEILDTDLLFWITTTDEQVEKIDGLVLRPSLAVYQDGREVFLGQEISAAFGYSTLLSLPFAIDQLVPMIEAALDSDPQTHADDRPVSVNP